MVEHLKGSSIGLAPALPTNIRLGWKVLPRTKTLGCYEHSQITKDKSFITSGPDHIPKLPASLSQLGHDPLLGQREVRRQRRRRGHRRRRLLPGDSVIKRFFVEAMS